MSTELSPWLSMWASPRSTIRSIVNLSPTYGVFYLASIYALQNYFFFASYWSFGLSFPFSAILITGLLLCPIFGWIWIYFTGWVLYITGKWLKGQAPMVHLRAAAAWSKIPCMISLIMWFVLMISGSDTIFINGVAGPTSLFSSFILFVLAIWSFVLLLQSIREVQGFSIARSIVNLIIAWCFSSVIVFVFTFAIFSLLRFFG